MRRAATAGVALLAALGCGSPDPGADPEPPGEPGPPPAPWSAEPLPATAVPDVMLDAWRSAENRATCALLAPTVARPEAAEAREARFGGGWGVAWDLPDLRSAFGVAGTGVEPTESTYDDWPYELRWADGSRAGYGPEGGSGPKQLAYLRLAGQRCLYNVWSHLGREHLEELLRRLRFVEGAAGP